MPSGHQNFLNPGMSAEDYLNQIVRSVAAQFPPDTKGTQNDDVLTADLSATLKMEAGLWQLVLNCLQTNNHR